MRMKVEQDVKVTLTMSGDDFKKMMDALNEHAYGCEVTGAVKAGAMDVHRSLVELAKISGFEWGE